MSRSKTRRQAAPLAPLAVGDQFIVAHILWHDWATEPEVQGTPVPATVTKVGRRWLRAEWESQRSRPAQPGHPPLTFAVGPFDIDTRKADHYSRTGNHRMAFVDADDLAAWCARVARGRRATRRLVRIQTHHIDDLPAAAVTELTEWLDRWEIFPEVNS